GVRAHAVASVWPRSTSATVSMEPGEAVSDVRSSTCVADNGVREVARRVRDASASAGAVEGVHDAEEVTAVVEVDGHEGGPQATLPLALLGPGQQDAARVHPGGVRDLALLGGDPVVEEEHRGVVRAAVRVAGERRRAPEEVRRVLYPVECVQQPRVPGPSAV